jgi:hypothetical protein
VEVAVSVAVSSRGLASRQLHSIAKSTEVVCESFAVISLDLKGVVPERAAGTAKTLELRQAGIESGATLRKTADHSYGLTTTTALFSGKAHDTIVWSHRP